MNITWRTLRLTAVAGVLALCLPASALGAVITVNTTADLLGPGGACSLREAISAANMDTAVGGCAAGSGTDTIVVPAGHYVLSRAGSVDNANATGNLDITSNLLIEGAGAASTTVDANGIDRVFDVLPSATATIAGVTITGGHAPDGPNGSDAANAAPGATSQGGDAPAGSDGGGVRNQGALTLRDDVVTGNVAGNGGRGGSGGLGGAGNAPPLGNGGNGGYSDGGVGGQGGKGGGVYSDGGTLSIVSTQITDNRAGDGGRGGDAAAGGDGGNAGGTGGLVSGTNGGDGGGSAGGNGGQGGAGGGVAGFGATLDLTDCVISGNVAGVGGNSGTPSAGGKGGAGQAAGSGGAGGMSGAYLLTEGLEQGGEGGGVAANGPTTITGCTITGNRTGDGGSGASGSTPGAGGAGGASGPGGAGSTSEGAPAGAAGGGGGISFNAATASLTVSDSTISGNIGGDGGDGGAGGEGAPGGEPGGSRGASYGGYAGSGSDGSGIQLFTSTIDVGHVAISASTVSGNTTGSGGGGGIAGAGLAGPYGSAGGDGGNAGEAAIFADAATRSVTLSHLTVSANTVGSPGQGGGADVTGAAGADGDAATSGGIDGYVSLAASVVAENAVAQCAGMVTNAGYDVSFPDAGCPGIDADPKLGALADNGGLTATQALLAGSAALRAIPAGDPLCGNLDQRGVAIPPGANCDSGAYDAVAPGVATGAAGRVTGTAATLNGAVAANGPSAGVRFEYGATTAYGSSTQAQSLGPGVAAQAVSASIGGLTPGTTYHYRLVATNPDGTNVGTDGTFTTLGSEHASFAGLRLSRQSVRLTSKGAAPVKVFCPASTPGKCTGTLELTIKVKHGKRGAVTVTLGLVRFAVAAGRHVTLEVKFTKAARARVKHAHHLSATATALAKDGLGQHETTHASVTVRPFQTQTVGGRHAHLV